MKWFAPDQAWDALRILQPERRHDLENQPSEHEGQNSNTTITTQTKTTELHDMLFLRHQQDCHPFPVHENYDRRRRCICPLPSLCSSAYTAL